MCLECVGVCLSVLDFVGVCCSVLQCVSVCCSVSHTHLFGVVALGVEVRACVRNRVCVCV